MRFNPIKLLCLSNIILFHHFIAAANAADADSEVSRITVYAPGGEGAFLDEVQRFLGKYIYSKLAGLLSETSTEKCVRDFNYIFESLAFGEWPIRMLDSFGKPESGILTGNIRWLGEFDECLAVHAPPRGETGVGDFDGQYCTLYMNVTVKHIVLHLSVGVCLPDSCNLSEKSTNSSGDQYFAGEFPGSGMNDTKLSCHPRPPKRLTAGAISVIFVISLFVLLAAIGSSITAYERFLEVDTKDGDSSDGISSSANNSILPSRKSEAAMPKWLEKSRGFFNCFCLISNGERILSVASPEGQLPCLHGIRFLSMSWVILCHAYAICFSVIRNQADIGKFIDHWTFQIILNGFYSVDSFFVLSAFLVAHLFFKQCSKSDGKIPWLYFYIHRYIRLTPVYMMVVFFYITMNSYLGSGPLWPDASENSDPNCSVPWWWNLFYINNFQADIQKCMAWTWYLANDMQFYIISPLFLVTLWRWPKVGYSVIAFFLCITYIASFVITYENKLITGIGNVATKFSDDITQFFPQWHTYFNKFYIKPYTRFDPYLIGIALAHYIFKRKQNTAGKLNWIALSVGWAVAAGITLTCLFGLYHQNPSIVGASFYNALNRTGFACGLAWLIFVCITEQGGVVNSILSWKLWIPLSRLTFCAYLLHPIVEIVYFHSIRTAIQLSHTTMILLYLGFMVVTYAAALLTSLLFESPVIGLERLIRSKFSS